MDGAPREAGSLCFLMAVISVITEVRHSFYQNIPQISVLSFVKFDEM